MALREVVEGGRALIAVAARVVVLARARVAALGQAHLAHGAVVEAVALCEQGDSFDMRASERAS